MAAGRRALHSYIWGVTNLMYLLTYFRLTNQTGHKWRCRQLAARCRLYTITGQKISYKLYVSISPLL